tara:strand:+ start:2059 stop:4410 length:2352 start_codon:yes stop_codon:yes gene_type:complete
MKTRILLTILIVALGSNVFSQSFLDLVTNIDTLFISGGTPSHLSLINPTVTPIVSSSPCNTPRYNYSVATQYQNGKVIAIAHEGLLSNNNINLYDNLTFLTNAIGWLNSGSKRVTLKQGWVNNNDISTLKDTLIADSYTFNTLSGNITSVSLANTDVLILGNDWNGTQPYLATELTALDNFVANGGSILIAGLGWSWPNALNLYPMNQVANLFGFEFTTDAIYDPEANINGSPKLYNFYPENLNTTPYCPSPFLETNLKRGDSLRVFRLAVSTTGEFTSQNGGIVATTLLLNQWIAEINDLYGREYCVRFEIIPDNNQIIFLDAATDPWGTLPAGSSGCTNAGIIMNQQSSVIDSIIDSANYDISHVIAGSPFVGGCAGGIKYAVSGGLDIPVTRHELGHQLAQDHTVNHGDNSNYEPETGAWTIQGGNGQGHAHAVSYHQLANFLLNDILTTGDKIPTGNNIPNVDAGADIVIPISTPFTLTGIASDNDVNDTLTYVWDNMNPGILQTIPVTDDSQGAIFQRLLPDNSSSRTFPKMSDVIANNNSNTQEQLPTQARIMDIRLTVNDNHQILYNGQMVNASGINSDDIQITVADAGPFVVTSQNTNGIIYPGGSSQMVTWDVNGTDSLPINTQNVTIRLSTDGGFTYPISLLASTANNGFAMVTLPNISTTNARIQVSALNSIYFDINTQNFEIQLILSTSEQDLSNSSILIYPNPTKDFFKIDMSYQINYKVEIFNIQGKLISSQLNRDLFDVSNLSNGIYLLLITDLDLNNKTAKKLLIFR